MINSIPASLKNLQTIEKAKRKAEREAEVYNEKAQSMRRAVEEEEWKIKGKFFNAFKYCLPEIALEAERRGIIIVAIHKSEIILEIKEKIIRVRLFNKWETSQVFHFVELPNYHFNSYQAKKLTLKITNECKEFCYFIMNFKIPTKEATSDEADDK